MIPVCLPKLPDAKALTPYLQKIDANRFYTNFGPLAMDLQARVAQKCGTSPAYVQTFANGMGALESAIHALVTDLARDHDHKGVALVPSWTFIASPHAALRMGIKPCFLDVSADDWSLSPDHCRAYLQKNPDVKVSIVLPVAPFGKALPIRQWEDFSKETGIPVLIDGAAMRIDQVEISQTVPVMVSLHATKYLPAGEGGLLFWENEAALKMAKLYAGFGIAETDIISAGTNFKMSEYHAAIALASLDEIEAINADYVRVIKRYHQNLNGRKAVGLAPVISDRYPNSFCIIQTQNPIDEAALNSAGIATRRWWRQGCHAAAFYAGKAHDPVPVSEHLAQHSIGVPCYRDLTDADIDMICQTLIEVCGE